MPEVGTGAMSQASIMRMQLAACAYWLTLTGAANATVASQSIFIGGFADDVEGSMPPRPRAMVRVVPENNRMGNLSGVMSGVVLIVIELSTPENYQALEVFSEAEIWFENQVGQIVAELRDLGRSIAGGYLPLSGDMELVYNGRSSEDRRESEGDFYSAEIAFPFGV